MGTKRPAAEITPAESVASSGGSARGELVRLVFSPTRSPDSAVLKITLLGNKHTLRDAAELLFQDYLEDQLNECLDDHVWGFTPHQSGGGMPDENDEDDNYGRSIMPEQPLLSTRLGVYHMFMGDPEVRERHFRLTDGTELLFSYDMGSPTELRVAVSLVPAPPGLNEADYPKVEKPGAAAEADSPAPRSTQPAGPADAAFPNSAATAAPLLARALGACLAPSRAALRTTATSCSCPCGWPASRTGSYVQRLRGRPT